MKTYTIFPGNRGQDCPQNGNDPEIECGCDECDYLMCCISANQEKYCIRCTDTKCPRKIYKK